MWSRQTAAGIAHSLANFIQNEIIFRSPFEVLSISKLFQLQF